MQNLKMIFQIAALLLPMVIAAEQYAFLNKEQFDKWQGLQRLSRSAVANIPEAGSANEETRKLKSEDIHKIPSQPSSKPGAIVTDATATLSEYAVSRIQPASSTLRADEVQSILGKLVGEKESNTEKSSACNLAKVVSGDPTSRPNSCTARYASSQQCCTTCPRLPCCTTTCPRHPCSTTSCPKQGCCPTCSTRNPCCTACSTRNPCCTACSTRNPCCTTSSTRNPCCTTCTTRNPCCTMSCPRQPCCTSTTCCPRLLYCFTCCPRAPCCSSCCPRHHMNAAALGSSTPGPNLAEVSGQNCSPKSATGTNTLFTSSARIMTERANNASPLVSPSIGEEIHNVLFDWSIPRGSPVPTPEKGATAVVKQTIAPVRPFPRTSEKTNGILYDYQRGVPNVGFSTPRQYYKTSSV